MLSMNKRSLLYAMLHYLKNWYKAEIMNRYLIDRILLVKLVLDKVIYLIKLLRVIGRKSI